MKQRKPLKPGDMVKFVGYSKLLCDSSNDCGDSIEWHEVVSHNKDERLVLNIFGRQNIIHRHQVTHVKRKKPDKKYVDRKSLEDVWDNAKDSGFFPSSESEFFKTIIKELRQEGYEGF